MFQIPFDSSNYVKWNYQNVLPLNLKLILENTTLDEALLISSLKILESINYL